jgi:D-alanyl-D-alanine carboxypeptidase/D-alanyl-D-alanine-endopeptidase (penicillin-binding protein 4)
MDYVKNSGNSRRRSRRSRGLKRRLVALATAFVLFAAAAWGLTRVLAPGGHARTALAALPRFEHRKAVVRTPPWSAAETARLRASLRSAFAPALAGADAWSFAVVDAGGATIYDDRATHAVEPASVQKLVVAATALDALGASFRYHTIFSAQQAIGADGSLDGDLWLVGSGDPSLRTDDLRNGIGTLVRGGLKRIGGSVAIDATSMRGPEINPHWDPSDEGQDYAAPTSAVSIDGDTTETDETEHGVEERFWTPIHGVAQFAASLLEKLLHARGISTGAPPIVSAAPLDSIVLWDHRSAPLRALEAHMLFLSDNHYAEQLLRTLGGGSGVSDDAGGIAAERRFLSQHGIPDPGLHLADGSGLSNDNRIAAITLARILSDSELRGGDASLYLLLPQGGRQGTLKDYDFTTALGRVRAKSGHITGVASLAGYANTLHHGRVAFAFLMNGSPGDPDAAIVRAVDRLASF